MIVLGVTVNGNGREINGLYINGRVSVVCLQGGAHDAGL